MSFSAYMPSITDIVMGTKYVLNGTNNENYKLFADAYEDSVTNSSCINDICNLIVGDGLINKNIEGKKPSIYISDSDLRLIVLDYKIQGQCAFETVWSEGKPVKIYHKAINTIGLNLDKKMRVNGYWYCYDWSKKFKYAPKFYPKFDGHEPKEGINLTVIKRPSNEPLFSRPSWFPALKWAQNEGKLAQHSYTDVSTGFTGQKIINWAGGQGLTKTEKQNAANNLRTKFSGEDGQRVIVSVNQTPENAVIVDNIEPTGVNASYINYTEEAERKILIANSYPAILLAGAKTGFSSNADEIEVATKSVFRRVCNPARNVLLEGFNKIFKTIDSNFILAFENFKEEKLDKNERDITTD